MFTIEQVLGLITAVVTGGVLQEIIRGLFGLKPGSRQQLVRKRNIEKVRDYDRERERRWVMEDYARRLIREFHRQGYDTEKLPPWPKYPGNSDPPTNEIPVKD